MPPPNAPASQSVPETSVSPSERRWVWGFAALILALSLLPYIVAGASAGTDWRFTGHLFGVEDGNTYIAKMLSGAAGAWLFRTPYTAFLQRGILMFLPYILLGKLAAPPALHEQLVVLYHLFRMAAGLLMILATYDFIAFFIPEIALRRIGLVLVTLGGGLGWLLILLGKTRWLGWLPVEFYSPEAFGFISLYGIPHLALARSLLLWGLLAYLQAVQQEVTSGEPRRPWLRQASRVGALWLLVGLAQPLTGMLAGAVAALHVAATGLAQVVQYLRHLPADFSAWRRVLRLAAVAALIAAPLVLYNLAVFSLDPQLRNWTQQSRIPAPPPQHYLVAYGLILPFAAFGGARLVRRSPWTGWLPAAWALALPLLAYAPFSMQRRLVEGSWVALVSLALCAWLPRYQRADLASRRRQMALAVCLLPVFLISNLLLLLGGFRSAASPAPPLFRPAAEVAAYEYLQANAPPGSAVLTAYGAGNALPAWAPVNVLTGHGPESAYGATVNPLVEAFYRSDTPDAARLDLIRRFNLRYVFWGPGERQLGDWQPGRAPFLQPVFSAGEYTVFAVNPVEVR